MNEDKGKAVPTTEQKWLLKYSSQFEKKRLIYVKITCASTPLSSRAGVIKLRHFYRKLCGLF